MRRRAAILTGLLLCALIVGGSTPRVETIAGQAHPKPCDWQTEMWGTVRALDSDPALWSIADGERDFAGRLLWKADRATAVIDPTLGCHYVADVVRHEWMHLQQHQAGLIEADNLNMVRIEMVADCGALLLGAEYTPYVDAAIEQYGGMGCTPVRLLQARALIG